MSNAFPYVAALVNALILGLIAWMLRNLGRAHQEPAAVVDLVPADEPLTETAEQLDHVEGLAPVESAEAEIATHRLAAFQKTMQAPIVLRLEDVVVPTAVEAPVPTAPVRRHHHH